MSRSAFTIAGSFAGVIAACALAGCGSSANAPIVGVPAAAPSAFATPGGGQATAFQQAQSRQLDQAIGSVHASPRVKQVRTKAPHLKLPH